MIGINYIGEKAREYWEYQSRLGTVGGRINARFLGRFVPAGGSVLDFGCGGGFMLAQLENKRKAGIEVNPHARAFGREQGLDIRESAGDFGQEEFDAVVTNHVLEHAIAPVSELRALAPLIKPGSGRLIVCVPIDDWRSQRSIDPKDQNHHLHTWTPLLLGNTVIESGLEPLQVEVATFAWPPLTAVLHRRLPWWLFRVLGYFWAVLKKRRSVVLVARRPNPATKAS